MPPRTATRLFPFSTVFYSPDAASTFLTGTRLYVMNDLPEWKKLWVAPESTHEKEDLFLERILILLRQRQIL